jgi:SAM-dependent methyltransferase
MDIERIWPTPGTEEQDRARHPDEYARYEFAARYAIGRRALDCACGAGYGSLLLLRSGAAQVIGVDVSEDALAHARRHFRGPDYRRGDGRTLPLETASVEVAVSLETLEHAPDAAQFLEELARVLEPGGTLVLSTPLCRGPQRLQPKNPHHLREYDEQELLALLAPRFELLERLGQHSRASRSFADLKAGPAGAALRLGLHRLLPGPLRALGRRLLGRRSAASAAAGPAAWVSAERWEEAPVQIVVARKR